MNKMMKLVLIAVFGVAILCAGGVKKAEAFGIIILDDPSIAGFEVIVADGLGAGAALPFLGGGFGAGLVTTHADMHPLANRTSIIAAVGTNWYANASTGISSLNPSSIHQDLNAETFTGAGTLNAWFSEIDFPGSTPGLIDLFGGVTAGTVTAIGYINDSNIHFDLANATPPIGPLGSGAFSGTSSLALVGVADPYSLTKFVEIVHTGKGITSYNNELNVVPEPGTIALLGIGLAGLVGVGVRRRMKKNVD